MYWKWVFVRKNHGLGICLDPKDPWYNLISWSTDLNIVGFCFKWWLVGAVVGSLRIGGNQCECGTMLSNHLSKQTYHHIAKSHIKIWYDDALILNRRRLWWDHIVYGAFGDKRSYHERWGDCVYANQHILGQTNLNN